MESTPWLPVLGAIVVGVMAGIVGLTVAILSKEAKVSEFRQIWINELRADLAELVALVEMVCYSVDARKSFANPQPTDTEFREWVRGTYHADLVKARMLGNRIALRLNPEEDAELLKACQEMSRLSPFQVAGIDAKALAIVDLARSKLKAEWAVVKEGEPIFKKLKTYFKYAVWALVIVAFLVIGSISESRRTSPTVSLKGASSPAIQPASPAASK